MRSSKIIQVTIFDIKKDINKFISCRFEKDAFDEH